MWCDHCKDNCPTDRDPETGSTCCCICGKVLSEDFFTDGPTFVKNSSGQCQLAGGLQRFASEHSLSRERTLNKGRDEISLAVDLLSISGGDSIINPAFNFYKIAVERNFTRGRPTSQVAAACLYIACRAREPMLPYLLIDFSSYLQISVYVLGAVFLQLCKLLSLEEHPIVQKPIDPSLFMNRFTQQLLGKDDRKVTHTALNIIASMKRDWMQTGRKPSGLCGAALYIAVHAHELTYSKAAIVNVVHVCEATLTKRLREFEDTESGNLTTEELDELVEKQRQESSQTKVPPSYCRGSGPIEMLCQHKNAKPSHYACGLCEKCYDEFVEFSGGLQGGSDPPAFQRAEMQRKEKSEKDKRQEELSDSNAQIKASNNQIRQELNASSRVASCTSGVPWLAKKHEEVETVQEPDDDPACHQSPELDEVTGSGDEEDRFSDIDDDEVAQCLLTEEEIHVKTIVWESNKDNQEYLREQEVKEAVAAAERERLIAMYGDDEEGLRAALELNAASAAAVAKSRKEKKQKRAEEAKKTGPARTAAEATSQMLKRKTFSSKINYDALKALYTSCEEGDPKKQRTDPDADDISLDPHDGKDGDAFDEVHEDADYNADDNDNADYNNDYNDDYNDYQGGDEFNDGYNYDDDYPGGDYNEYDEEY